MPLIAHNHFEFIIEISIFIYFLVTFLINFVPSSLSLVFAGSIVISLGLTFIFGLDVVALFLSFGQSEFTHPFGPIALFSVITALASLRIMKRFKIEVESLQKLVMVIILAITIFGGLMHRSFLLLWILGLLIGFIILSKNFRRKSNFNYKIIVGLVILGIIAFGGMELLSQLLNMPIFSPLLRIERIETNSISSLAMVIKNLQLFGHSQGSCFWADACRGFADGYISLPFSLILFFALPYPMFFGVLITKKDIIDYMLPGIFGYAFDFGIFGLLLLLGATLFTIYIGFKILVEYRRFREQGDKTYIDKEALLVGSLTAFIAQAIIGLFLMTRSINGTALLTFIFLGSSILAHVVTIGKGHRALI